MTRSSAAASRPKCQRLEGRRSCVKRAPAWRIGQHLFRESQALLDGSSRDQRARLRSLDRSDDAFEGERHPRQLQGSFGLAAVGEDQRALAGSHLNVDAAHARLECEVRHVVVEAGLDAVPVAYAVRDAHEGVSRMHLLVRRPVLGDRTGLFGQLER